MKIFLTALQCHSNWEQQMSAQHKFEMTIPNYLLSKKAKNILSCIRCIVMKGLLFGFEEDSACEFSNLERISRQIFLNYIENFTPTLR